MMHGTRGRRLWPLTPMAYSYFYLMIIILISLSPVLASSPPPPNGMILRIRRQDGTIQKIQIAGDSDITVAQALSRFDRAPEDSIQVMGSTIDDPTQSLLSSLNLKNGSLISLVAAANKENLKTPPSFRSTSTTKHRAFVPFPELAKDHSKKRASTTSGVRTYTDIANLQSSLHIVEPQPKGPLERIYMCSKSAQRLTPGTVGLLLGNICKERLEQSSYKTTKLKTSLSTSIAPEYCQVAKVQAMWIPSPSSQQTQINNDLVSYDATPLLEIPPRVAQLAQWLDFIPLGWIYTHKDRTSTTADTTFMYGHDMIVAAQLQIMQMKRTNDGIHHGFVTCSMDSATGTTEAFQLSNVIVQMVAEGMIVPNNNKGTIVTTTHPIVVDGKETNTLETVLCVINTAMLAHEGTFAGGDTTIAKKTGRLLSKTKKALLAALDDDGTLLNMLCDFNVLLAIDSQMKSNDMEMLCQMVKKWSRGQKQGTQVSRELKMQLKNILSQ